MEAKTLITAEGLIVAALLAWGQYWVQVYHIYKGSGDPIWKVSLALSGIYFAVLISLLSIGLAFYSLGANGAFYEPSVALAGFSATIAFLMVLASSLTTYVKALQGWDQWHPLSWRSVWPPRVLFAKRGSHFRCTLGACMVGLIILLIWLCWLGPCLVESWN